LNPFPRRHRWPFSGGDRYGGEWPAERFGARGITYVPAEKPKSDLYRDLLPILNAHRAELLDLPRLGAQLCSLERRTARGGRDSIDHPPGTHDDMMARPSIDHQHCDLHGLGAKPVQRLLAGLMQRRGPHLHEQDRDGFDRFPKERTAAEIEADLDAAVDVVMRAGPGLKTDVFTQPGL
jgi:hypothetical protein